MSEQRTATLSARLGGYDAIAAVADDLLPRLVSDPQLGRFWTHRAADSIRWEKHATLDRFQVPAQERREVLAFVESTRANIVEK